MPTEKELYAKYPKIFPLMDNPYFYVSSSIPDGWFRVIDWLCESIQSYTDNINNNNKHLPPVPQVICEQIKEKYAGLRFYSHGGDDATNGMIEMAETICSHTCQCCGSFEGKLIDKGWMSILCDNCDTK